MSPAVPNSIDATFLPGSRVALWVPHARDLPRSFPEAWFSLQSKNLLRPSRTLNGARGPIRCGGEEAHSAKRRGLNKDHFTGGEDGCIAVAVGVHRGEAAGVEVIDHLLTGDPVARCAQRLLDGNRRGAITGMQRGNREESEE